MPWEETDDFIRSGHGDKNKYSTCRTTTFDDKLPKGIKAVYCKRKDNSKWEIQSYLFPKSQGWNMGNAKSWFKSHNKSINKNVIAYLTRNLIKSGNMPAMIIDTSIAKMINGEIVNVIVKTKEFKKYLKEPIALAGEDNKIYTIVTLNEPIKVDKKQFNVLIDKHGIDEIKLEQLIQKNKEWNNDILWLYSFKMLRKFDMPIDFYIPPDTKDWIDGVNIMNLQILDITKELLQKSSKGELQDLHEKIHSIWKLLKKIEVTEKRIKTIELLINKHNIIKEIFVEKEIEHQDIDTLDNIGNDNNEEDLQKIIRQEGKEWVLYSSDGKKVLGRHKSEKEALAQERAILVNKQRIEKFIPICKIDEEKCIVYGEVLVPDVVDAQGDKITVEEIEKACHWYMENSQKSKVMHKGDFIETAVVENYIAPIDMTVKNMQGESYNIKKGTWIMATKIYDDKIWQQVKSGELTGYSIGGVGYKEEIQMRDTFNCSCIKCGYKIMKSEQHCSELKCPKCGGQMRRVERPSTGQE